MEPVFLGRLHLLASHPLVGEVRGKGLLAGVELVANKDTKKAFDPKYGVGKYCADRAEGHGLIIRAIGDTIAFCPPLIITESEITLMISRFNAALDDTLMMVRKSGYFE
jgi:4-aminobutyrate--pyruvate transaminase